MFYKAIPKSFQAAKKAMEKAFGKEVLPYRSGGSIPITSLLRKFWEQNQF